MEETKTPGWVVHCTTLATWEIIHQKGREKPVVEIRKRHGSQILYAGTDPAKANETYEFYAKLDSFPAIYIEEVDNLPGWGSGRFL